MKKTVFILLAIMVLMPACAFSETITLASDCWMPYICGTKWGHDGIAVDITKAIFKKVGYQVELKIVPWTRAVEMTRKGKYTAIVCAAKNDAPDFVFPEEHVVLRQTCFYTNENSQWNYEGIPSLLHISLGVVGGYHYYYELDDYIEKRKNSENIQIVHGENAIKQNILKLISGRIKACCADPFVLQYILFQNELSGVRKAGCAPGATKLYLAFSPALSQSQKYAKRFSEGMRALIASEKTKEIYAAYGIEY